MALEYIWKQDKVGILHKLEVSGFKILRKKVQASYFIDSHGRPFPVYHNLTTHY